MFLERWARSFGAGLFDEGSEELRRIALLLYALVTPPFTVATFVLTAPGPRRYLPAATVLALCAAGGLVILVRRRLSSFGWMFPAAIVPCVCCGIAFSVSGTAGVGFLVAMGAPVAWGCVLFDLPSIVAAWLTATVTCFVVVAINGNVAHAAMSALVVAVTQGLAGWVGYGKSTRHREVQRELRASQELFAVAFESFPDSASLSDLQTGRYIQANAAFQRLSGYSKEHIVGKDAVELSLWIDPEARRSFLDEFISKGRVRGFTARVRLADGSSRLGEFFADGVTIHGRRCLLVTTRDLTEREHAALELRRERDFGRLVMNTMAQGLTVTDAASRFDYVNPAYARMLGYPAEELVGRSPVEFTAPEARDALASARARRAAGETTMYESRLVRRDGSVVDVLVTGAPRWMDGVVHGAIAVVTDLTSQKQAEESRLLLERQVQQAQKRASLGTMAGGIAHHFNNLLLVMMGNLELLQAEPDISPAVAGFTQQALLAARRAAKISQAMLDYSGRRTRPRKGSVGVAQLEPVLALLASSIPANVRFETDLGSNVPPAALELDGLEQVVTSLVTNAAEALGTLQGSIRVSARAVARRELPPSALDALAGDDQVFVGLDVCDDGPGMEPPVLARAMDPFFTTRLTGRGLGLPVSLGIVQAAHGTLYLESTPGRGTVAHVFLPAATE